MRYEDVLHLASDPVRGWTEVDPAGNIIALRSPGNKCRMFLRFSEAWGGQLLSATLWDESCQTEYRVLATAFGSLPTAELACTWALQASHMIVKPSAPDKKGARIYRRGLARA